MSDFKKDEINGGKGITIMTVVWKILSVVIIGTDYEEKAVKSRRFFSGLIDIGIVFGIYLFLDETIGHTSFLFIGIVVAFYVGVEGIAGLRSVGKVYLSLQLVVEDFKQLNQETDYRLGRLLLRSIVKALSLSLTVVMFFSGVGLWKVIAILYWGTFRFTSGSRVLHDYLSGTHVDGLEDSIGVIYPNKYYKYVDMFLDSIFQRALRNDDIVEGVETTKEAKQIKSVGNKQQAQEEVNEGQAQVAVTRNEQGKSNGSLLNAEDFINPK